MPNPEKLRLLDPKITFPMRDESCTVCGKPFLGGEETQSTEHGVAHADCHWEENSRRMGKHDFSQPTSSR